MAAGAAPVAAAGRLGAGAPVAAGAALVAAATIDGGQAKGGVARSSGRGALRPIPRFDRDNTGQSSARVAWVSVR